MRTRAHDHHSKFSLRHHTVIICCKYAIVAIGNDAVHFTVNRSVVVESHYPRLDNILLSIRSWQLVNAANFECILQKYYEFRTEYKYESHSMNDILVFLRRFLSPHILVLLRFIVFVVHWRLTHLTTPNFWDIRCGEQHIRICCGSSEKCVELSSKSLVSTMQSALPRLWFFN